MLECIYRKDNIELVYDTEENVFYIRIELMHDTEEDVLYIRVYCEYVGIENIAYCTQDYIKEELITILKEMIKTLNV